MRSICHVMSMTINLELRALYVPSRVLHLAYYMARVTRKEGEQHFHTVPELGGHMDARFPILVRSRERCAQFANQMMNEYVQTSCLERVGRVLGFPSQAMEGCSVL